MKLIVYVGEIYTGRLATLLKALMAEVMGKDKS
jgi:hypothetical protein